MIKRLEIGSEFEKCSLEPLNENSLSVYNYVKNMIDGEYKFLISGRASIEWAIKDILAHKKIKCAYLPSYICESVVKPFKNNNIHVEYYDVIYDNEFKIQIDEQCGCDVFFAMNYFGYSQNTMDKYIKEFKKKGAIVIEDITHSLLLDKPYCKASDYVVASLRKWFPIASGGVVIKLGSKYEYNCEILKSDDIVTTKILAMDNKKKYLEYIKDESIKDVYLKQYGDFNSLLNIIEFNYEIDNFSVDILKNLSIHDIIKKRKSNAYHVHKKLQDLKEITLLFEMNETSVPIFVPIMVQKDSRDNLRKFMVNNLTYLPCHWPPESGKRNGTIYDRELSLVVDQRYDVPAIDIMCNNLLCFFKEREK